MTPDESLSAETTEARARSYRVRALSCRCRWWPLSEPQDVSDEPVLAVCLHCGDVRSLRAVMG